MTYVEYFIAIFKNNVIEELITLILLVLFFISRSIIGKIVRKHAQKNKVVYSRELYIRKLVNLSLVLLLIILIGAVWEISFKGLSLYFASIFTVVGVALFATWSVLSNLTASIILFFFFPYRIGGSIKIIDGDNSVEGQIMDITLFYIKVETDDNKIVTYPNNLAIQKPIMQSK
ncbi:mechanosensitive ion channel [Fulvivirgaceae bacterium BMA12]|uniref:Mechanosensitive ion channel n=1 Tax=Agaribacillus aureus TaxID=3051825 RepID=A0ABT8L5I0_9BACT|nr:mechanosensitive ion channel [Fulvivirgaceae bacterium BMA12]